mgnify:CR=1 FL=1
MIIVQREPHFRRRAPCEALVLVVSLLRVSYIGCPYFVRQEKEDAVRAQRSLISKYEKVGHLLCIVCQLEWENYAMTGSHGRVNLHAEFIADREKKEKGLKNEAVAVQ